MPTMEPRQHRLKTDLVCIIGGGIGGLAAAVALQKDGANVKVFERDQAFDDRKQGYGLTITNNPVGPLAKLGILELVRDWDDKKAPSNRHWIFKSNGDILGYYGQDFEEADSVKSDRNPTHGAATRGNLRIPRQELRRALIRELKTDSVAWGKELLSLQMAKTEGKGSRNNVCVGFSDGSSVNCSLLIGADGIRSRTRSILEPNNSPVYTGIFIVLGISSYNHPLLDQGGFYTLDGKHRIFTMPYNHDQCMWQFSFALESEQDAKDLMNCVETHTRQDEEEEEVRGTSQRGEFLKRCVLQRCFSWHRPVSELVNATDSIDIWGTPLYDRVPYPRSYGGCKSGAKELEDCVVFVGDAAHPMTPFKGQGANQALTDGVKLAGQLSKSNLISALKAYEREMVNASATKVLDSRFAAAFLHSPAVLDVYASSSAPSSLKRKKQTVEFGDENGALGAEEKNEIEPGVCNGVLKFSGVADWALPEFIHRLQDRKINANMLEIERVDSSEHCVQQQGVLVKAVEQVIQEMAGSYGKSIAPTKSKWKRR